MARLIDTCLPGLDLDDTVLPHMSDVGTDCVVKVGLWPLHTCF